VKIGDEMSYVAHDGVVPSLEDDASSVALDDAGGEEGHVPGLQHCRISPLRVQRHSLTFPCQAGIVHLVNKLSMQ